MDENDFLNALNLQIFYFEVKIETTHNSIKKQNYINNEDN